MTGRKDDPHPHGRMTRGNQVYRHGQSGPPARPPLPSSYYFLRLRARLDHLSHFGRRVQPSADGALACLKDKVEYCRIKR